MEKDCDAFLGQGWGKHRWDQAKKEMWKVLWFCKLWFLHLKFYSILSAPDICLFVACVSHFLQISKVKRKITVLAVIRVIHGDNGYKEPCEKGNAGIGVPQIFCKDLKVGGSLKKRWYIWCGFDTKMITWVQRTTTK